MQPQSRCAPTLLIWGEKDQLIGESGRCALREALPGARVHVFPDYGHNPFWEDPEAVAAVVNPFLRERP
jgi:pimeloyl-ACP methyl ester carboxylesterase